jgi:threonine aldolase
MFFLSDNGSGIAPQVMDALNSVNTGPAFGYGDDEANAKLRQRFAELFEIEIEMFLVGTGSAANSLSLAVLSPPYGVVFCHQESHIQTDECCAPEFFTQGAKLFPLGGEHGKISRDEFELAIDRYPRGVVHRPQLGALSLSQATESGGVYSLEAIAELSELAKAHDIPVHMDGARFANALVSLGCTPAQMTWQSGVDVLSFGATKNGALAAEAVIFFNKDLVRDFNYRQKRAGHLFSKSRYPAAQFNAYLSDGLWLDLATRANEMATKLSNALVATGRAQLTSPVEANQVFAEVKRTDIEKLQAAGAVFYVWTAGSREDLAVVRLVTSFQTTDSDVDNLINALTK